jgi:hypothetical protein
MTTSLSTAQISTAQKILDYKKTIKALDNKHFTSAISAKIPLQ